MGFRKGAGTTDGAESAAGDGAHVPKRPVIPDRARDPGRLGKRATQHDILHAKGIWVSAPAPVGLGMRSQYPCRHEA